MSDRTHQDADRVLTADEAEAAGLDTRTSTGSGPAGRFTVADADEERCAVCGEAVLDTERCPNFQDECLECCPCEH